MQSAGGTTRRREVAGGDDGGLDAGDCYREALALAGKLGMRPLVAQCHLALGRLSRRAGEEQDVREHVTAAAALYRQMHMQGSLQDVEGIGA